MERSMSEQEYQRVKDKNQDCLNFDKIVPKNIVKEFNHWMIYKPTNDCGYKEYDGHKVRRHYLIVPKEDVEDLDGLSLPEKKEYWRVLEYLNDKFKNRKTIIFWKTKTTRSIKKYHAHLVIIKEDKNLKEGGKIKKNKPMEPHRFKTARAIVKEILELHPETKKSNKKLTWLFWMYEMHKDIIFINELKFTKGYEIDYNDFEKLTDQETITRCKRNLLNGKN